GQRREHEALVQFGPRKLQVAGSVKHLLVVQDDVDIGGAARPAWPAPVAAQPLLERMQPVVERNRVQPGVDAGGGIEESRAVESDCGRAVDGRQHRRPEPRRQGGNGGAQVALGFDVAAQAQPGPAHPAVPSFTRKAGMPASASGAPGAWAAPKACIRSAPPGAWYSRSPNSGSIAIRWSKMSDCVFS